MNFKYKKEILEKKSGEYEIYNSKKKPLLSVILPCFYSMDKVWISFESLVKMDDSEIPWELIICDEYGDTVDTIIKYLMNIIEKNCVRILYIVIDPKNEGEFDDKYTLLEKWKRMASLATSEICLLQSDDDYSPPTRFKETLKNFKNHRCYFSTQPIGLFYNIKDNNNFIYDGNKRKRYSHIRMMHINMAHTTKHLKKIKIKFLKSAIDQYMLRDIYTQRCEEDGKLINLNKHIFYDETDSWKYGFFTDGLNSISVCRIKLYNINKEKINKLIEHFKITNGNKLATKNGELLNASNILKVTWCLSTYNSVKSYYKYLDIGYYIDNKILKLLVLEKYMKDNNLLTKNKYHDNFYNLLPVKNQDINIRKLKQVGIWNLASTNKSDIILDPEKYLLLVNINDINILVKNNRKSEQLKIYLKILTNNFYCKKIVYILDIHNYTFIDGYPNLLKKLMMFNIQYLCCRVKYCKEYFFLKSYLHPYCNVISVPHLIKPTIFKNYNQKKIYDILFYGSDYKKSYPFRHRLKNLLKTPIFQKEFKIRIIEWKEGLKGENLSKEIGKSYLAISTKSIFNYLVKKYFEITLSNTFLLCDMPSYGYEYFERDNFIHIHEKMNDQEIFNIIQRALLNKKELLTKTEKVREKIFKHQSYKLHDYAVNEIDEEIITVGKYNLKKNIIIVKNIKENDIYNLKLIMSYQTIIASDEIIKILKKYLPNKEYLNIEDLKTDLSILNLDLLPQILKSKGINVVILNNIIITPYY